MSKKIYYMLLCSICYKELGKPKHYDFHEASSYFAPNIVTDSFGDEPYEDHSKNCSRCHKSFDSYYSLEGYGYGIKIDSLEEFEKVINENNVALVRFGNGFQYYSPIQEDYEHILFIQVGNKYSKDICKKEEVDQFCYVLYFKGEKNEFSMKIMMLHI